MDQLGAVIGGFGFLALIIGVVMFIPIPALKLRRSLAKKLAIGGGVAFVIGLILSPTAPTPPAAPVPGEKRSIPVADATGGKQPRAITTTSSSSTPVVASSTDDARAKSLGEARAKVLDYVRAASMQVVFCTGEVDYAQSSIEKVSAGRAPAMTAYSAAHVGERDCKKASTELAQLEKAPFADQSLNAMLSRTLPSCRSTTREGGSAMTLAKAVLDGNSSLGKAQQYKDARNSMVGKAIECKMGLLGLAEEAGLPKDQVDFLR